MRSSRVHHHPERDAAQRRQIEKQIQSRRSAQYRAAIANPLWFALPSVDRGSPRAVPSGRPRACGARVSARARDPGLPCRLAPAVLVFERDARKETKNPPERCSGGSAGKQMSARFMRGRSHEPGVRRQTADSRLAVSRCNSIRVAWPCSCSIHGHHVREGAASTLRFFRSQHIARAEFPSVLRCGAIATGPSDRRRRDH